MTEGTDYRTVDRPEHRASRWDAASGDATLALTPTDDAIAEGDEAVSTSGSSDVPVTPATLTLSDDEQAVDWGWRSVRRP